MSDFVCRELISHRQTKAFTVHTSTALQLKTDTSPKPFTPRYYCDISNLSLPMTGLMIMFPVLFQPQITANSVIRGLMWPLCKPSSGPLTVYWPGAVLAPLRYAWAFRLGSDIKTLVSVMAANQVFQDNDMVTVKPLFLIFDSFAYLIC